MEIWFVAAVAGAVLAGISNFYFKIAASRGYNADVFIFYGGLNAFVFIALAVSIFDFSL